MNSGGCNQCEIFAEVARKFEVEAISLRAQLKRAYEIASNRREKVRKHVALSRAYQKQISNLNKELKK